MHRQFTTGWHQQIHRWAFRDVLQSDQLIANLSVCHDGRIDIETIDWDDYWCRFEVCGKQWVEYLDAIKVARSFYIKSGYDLRAATAYSQTYFALLRELVLQPNCPDILRAILGFECFGVNWSGDDHMLAGATLTIRHPVYLLAKLREPNAYDDAKFLPIICPTSIFDSTQSSFFYYYRQIKVQNEPSASLLIYPTVDLSTRLESFGCIDAVSSALSFRPDPRSRQRAKAIADWAVAPFISHTIGQTETPAELSFVDIGGGSGTLLAEVCKQLISEHRDVLDGRKITWSIVDVGAQDATRRAWSPELRQHMSCIDHHTSDYAAWIADQANRTESRTYDIALVCRLLNNLSHINIESSNTPTVVAKMTRMRNHAPTENYHPSDCLAGSSPDCQSLVASNSRVRLDGGVTFRQASLTDFFRGLYLVSGLLQNVETGSVFYPIRRFNCDALLLPNGHSLLDKLSLMANQIVIEDVDLTADIMVKHLRAHGLAHLAATDATDRVRMQSARLLCVAQRKFKSALPGKSIW